MARDVEQGQRRPRERPAASEDDSAYASSSRGSSDGEGSQGSRGAASKTAEASTATTTPAGAAPPLTTFPAAALSRWFASSSSAAASAPAPAPAALKKLPTKLYDPLENNTPVAIRFDDDENDDEEAAGGVETAASVTRRILGAAAAAAAAAREERRLRRSSCRRRCILSALLLVVASALAAAISSPWWLSATLLRPPRTHELPFVFIEAPAATAATTKSPASSSSSSASPPFAPGPREIVPRIIHQSWKTHSTPPKWDAARRSCAELHPGERGWEVRLWSDGELREAVREAALRIAGGGGGGGAHVSGSSSLSSSSSSQLPPVARDLLNAYDSYPNPVQRADISRYAVLFLHGGVYLDLDVQCERPLDSPGLGLLEKAIVLPRTWPAGVSNDVIVAAPGCGLLELALRSAATAKRITSVLLFPSGYGKVMFSTGPMFLTLSALRWRQRSQELWVMPARLYGKYREKNERKAGGGGYRRAAEAGASSSGCDGDGGSDSGGGNRLNGAGAACGALFTHLHGSSWHGRDAELVAAWVRGGRKKGKAGGGRGAGAVAAAAGVSAVVAVVVIARKVRTKRQEEKKKQQQELQIQLQLQQQQQQQQLLQMQQRRPASSQQQQQKQRQQRPLGLFEKKKRPLVPAATPSLSKQH